MNLRYVTQAVSVSVETVSCEEYITKVLGGSCGGQMTSTDAVSLKFRSEAFSQVSLCL